MSRWGATTTDLSTQQATQPLKDDVSMYRNNIVDYWHNIFRLQPHWEAVMAKQRKTHRSEGPKKKKELMASTWMQFWVQQYYMTVLDAAWRVKCHTVNAGVKVRRYKEETHEGETLDFSRTVLDRCKRISADIFCCISENPGFSKTKGLKNIWVCKN